jgi:hypothetical protein
MSVFVGLLVTFSALVLVAGSVAAAPEWSPGAIIALPAQASGESSVLTSVSCWGAGNCEAVGTFLNNAGLVRPMAVNDNGGVWGQAQEIELPAASSPERYPHLNRISCSQPGWCAATGLYVTANGRERPIVVSERDGIWGRATEVQLPNAAESEAAAGLMIRSVSCAGAGDCVAVGSYIEAIPTENEIFRAFVLRSTNGAWEDTAKVVVTPGQVEEKPNARLESVACWAPGSCTAVGQYRQTYEGRLGFRAMGVTEIAGTWQPATDIGTRRGQDVGANLVSVACGASGGCEAVGNLVESGREFPLVAAGAGAGWRGPYEIAVPADGTLGEDSRLLQITCIDEKTCAAIGAYRGRYGDNFGMFASGTIEAVGPGQAITDPLASSGSDESSLYRISCTSGPLCETLGEYRDEETFEKPMFLAESGSPFTPASRTPEKPPGYESAVLELSSISCAGGACVVVGETAGSHGWLPTVFFAGTAEAPSLPPGTSIPHPSPNENVSTPPISPSAPLPDHSLSVHQPAGGVLGAKVRVSGLRFSARRHTVYISCAGGPCDGRLKLVRHLRIRRHGRWLTTSVVLARATYRLPGGGHAWVALVPTSSGRALLARMGSSTHTPAHLTVVAG